MTAKRVPDRAGGPFKQVIINPSDAARAQVRSVLCAASLRALTERWLARSIEDGRGGLSEDAAVAPSPCNRAWRRPSSQMQNQKGVQHRGFRGRVSPRTAFWSERQRASPPYSFCRWSVRFQGDQPLLVRGAWCVVSGGCPSLVEREELGNDLSPRGWSGDHRSRPC